MNVARIKHIAKCHEVRILEVKELDAPYYSLELLFRITGKKENRKRFIEAMQNDTHLGLKLHFNERRFGIIWRYRRIRRLLWSKMLPKGRVLR